MILPEVIETIWKKDIPKKTREKAVREAYQIANRKLADFEDLAHIGSFCCWAQTPSGANFWLAINDARNRIIKDKKVSQI